MSNTSVTYLVGACAGVFGFAAYAGWILVPALNAYTRVWQRLAATVLSLYVLAALVGSGVAIGLLLVYSWDRL